MLGLDVATEGAAIRERVGYMPEHDCLPPDVSATEFVVHMARMSGLPPTAARERTADTLRHVGLYEERYRPIGGYSTGMKQRVKLAQALVHDPQLVLLDEPTNGLDPVGRDEMLGLIRRIGTDFGISVLVTSHLLGELERICDHVVVIDGGRLLRSSSTSDFTQTTATLAVEVTDTDAHPDGTARCARRSTRAGVDVPRRRRLPGAGHMLLRRPRGRGDVRLVRDAVADLGLGLVRMEQRRHRIAEVFTDTTRDDAERKEAVGARQLSSRRGTGRAAGDQPTSSTTSATAPTTARASAARYARRSLYSQTLRGAYGLGRSAKSKVLPMLLLAVMCCPPLIMVAVAVVTKAERPAGRLHPLRDHHAGRHRPLRRRPGAAVRLPRPALQDDPAVLLPAARARSTTSRAKYAALAAALFILTGAAAARSSTSARCWRSSTSPTRPTGFAQGLVSVALLSLLFAGIGLVIAAVTPRRGFGVAAVIAVLTHLLRRGLHASRASPTTQDNDDVDRLARAVLAVHADRRRADRVPRRRAPPSPAASGPATRRRASSTCSSSSA